MRTNAKLSTCAIAGVCLIFTQLHPRLLAQDNPNGHRIASIDSESQSSSDEVSSTNGRSEDVPVSASNVSQDSPATQKPTPQIDPDSPKKPGTSLKKLLLIGAGVAAAITAFFLINKSKPEPQVSVGTPSVGVPQ